MSFITSIYASPVQKVSTSAVGLYPIADVNADYSAFILTGWRSTNASGFVQNNRFRVEFLSTGIQNQISISGQGNFDVYVEHFKPRFFFQPFKHGTIVITTGNNSNPVAHGLVLGPNAYVRFNGQTSTRGADPGGFALLETMVTANVRITATQIIAEVNSADYATAPGSVTVSYTIIDPK